MILKKLAQVVIDGGDLGLPQSNFENRDVQNGLQIVFGFAGSLAVLIIVIAGLRYVVSAGDPKAAAKARSAIIFAVAGLVISAIAFSIVTFVIGRL